MYINYQVPLTNIKLDQEKSNISTDNTISVVKIDYSEYNKNLDSRALYLRNIIS